MTIHRVLLLVLTALALLGAAGRNEGATPGARGADAFEAGDPRVEAELLIDAAEIQPARIDPVSGPPQNRSR